jgi:hypothetical protein
MEKEQTIFIELNFVVAGINSLIHFIFISPFQQLGFILSILLLFFCIGQSKLLSWIRDYYIKKENKAEVETDPSNLEEQLEKNTTNGIFSLLKSLKYSTVQSLYLFLSFILAFLISVIPSFLIPTDLNFEDIEGVYTFLKIFGNSMGVILLIQYVIVPTLYVVAIVFGIFGYAKDV